MDFSEVCQTCSIGADGPPAEFKVIVVDRDGTMLDSECLCRSCLRVDHPTLQVGGGSNG